MRWLILGIDSFCSNVVAGRLEGLVYILCPCLCYVLFLCFYATG